MESIPEEALVEHIEEMAERKIFKMQKPTRNDQDFIIKRENDTFIIESPGIEKMIKRMNFGTQDAVARFARIMRQIGVDKELRTQGAKDGNFVRIGDFEFEFVERE
jgi:GTP-binding protein